MKHVVTAFLLSLPLAVLAADATSDESFYKQAAEAGTAEVEEGNLAMSKASSQDVKDFASMMVKDHTAANNKLKRIAESKGVKLPSEPGMKHKAMKQKLEMKSADSF